MFVGVKLQAHEEGTTHTHREREIEMRRNSVDPSRETQLTFPQVLSVIRHDLFHKTITLPGGGQFLLLDGIDGLPLRFVLFHLVPSE